MTKRSKTEGALRAQVKRLEAAAVELRKHALLRDPLSGIPSDTLPRYLDALAQVVVERGAPGRGAMDSSGRPGKGTREPDPRPGWADDLLQREMRFLRRRSEWLTEWLAHPRPVSAGRGRRCEACGQGLMSGARYCPWCGKEAEHTQATGVRSTGGQR